jgi:hypothetical protein
MTLAIAGSTNCALKRCSPWKRGGATRCASRANAPVRPRIAVVYGGTRAFWRLYKTRSIPSMRRWWTGSVANLIQRPLIWMRSTASSKTSHPLEGEGSDNFADRRCGVPREGRRAALAGASLVASWGCVSVGTPVAYTHVSIWSPSTRPNSRGLFVTRVTPRLRACAAISRSMAPFGPRWSARARRLGP